MKININRIIIGIVFGGAVFFQTAWAESPDSLVMATIHQPESYDGRLSEMIYQEIFRRLGIKLVITTYPVPRATMLSERGEVAGVLDLGYEYQSKVKNLIRVEEPLWEFRLAGFALKPLIRINGWESLKGVSLQINHRRGFSELERRLPELVDTQHIETVTETKQGLGKLIRGRCDLYIDIDHHVMSLLATPEFRKGGIINVGTLKTSTAHGYIHKNHKDLIPKIEAILIQMKKEGLIKIYQENISRQ